jgi:hypothetical protein
MKNLSLLLFVLFLSSFSCRKEDDSSPPPPPPPVDTTKPVLVWKSFLNDQRMECTSPRIVMYEDYVIFGSERFGVLESSTISAYNNKSGSKVWSWNEWVWQYADPSHPTNIATSGRYIMLTDRDEFHKVDMKTGQTQWRNVLPDDAGGENRVSIFGNIFFTTHDDKNDDFSALVRCNFDHFRGWTQYMLRTEEPTATRPITARRRLQ